MSFRPGYRNGLRTQTEVSELGPLQTAPSSMLLVNGTPVPMDTMPGRRLGACIVKWDSLEIPDPLRSANEYLQPALQRLQTTSVGSRIPVLISGCGFGASASEVAIAGLLTQSTIPFVSCEVSGVEVVYGAVVSADRALGRTLAINDDAEFLDRIVLLDRSQIRYLVEHQGMTLRELPSPASVTPVGGDRLPRCWALVTSPACAVFSDGRVRRSTRPTTHSATPTMADGDAVKALESMWRSGRGTFPRQRGRSVDFRTWLGNAGRVDKSGLEPLKEGLDEIPLYSALIGSHPQPVGDSYVVTANVKNKYRAARPSGDFAVSLPVSEIERLGLGREAALSYEASWGKKLHVLAAVVPEPHPAAECGVVAVDETLRDAVGVQIGERVDVSRIVDPHRRGWGADKIIRKRYLAARAQVSDFTTFETGTCSMPQMALDVLGVRQGDRLIIESVACSGSVMTKRSVTLRVFATPESQDDKYSALLQPSVDARFPHCAELLGIEPDLPRLFIDSEARSELGLGLCSPVKVRASRADQWLKESREVAFVLLIAMTGAVSLLDSDDQAIHVSSLTVPLNAVLLLVALVLTGVLMYLGLRRRLH